MTRGGQGGREPPLARPAVFNTESAGSRPITVLSQRLREVGWWRLPPSGDASYKSRLRMVKNASPRKMAL